MIKQRQVSVASIVLALPGLLLVSSCGNDDASDADLTGNGNDAGAVTNPRPESMSPGGSSPSEGDLVPVEDPSSPSDEDPVFVEGSLPNDDGALVVDVPPGLTLACSDESGVPVCCSEDGACWEHGIPDDTGALPDGSAWERVATAASPPPRGSHPLAYDTDRSRLVLFGGRGQGDESHLGDTWEYDGENWSEVTTSVAPSPRRNHALVFDEARSRVVLFGGWNGELLGDTWEYDGENWSEVTTERSPPTRDGYAFAYDSMRSRVVLFGGYRTTALMNDTWEYDGTNWVKVVTPNSPPARRGMVMVYDTARSRMVVFGGRGGIRTPAAGDTPVPPDECRADGGNQVFNDTWEYDGADWREVTTSAAPRARSNYSMVYDIARERTVLFGGFDDPCVGVFLGDTWEYTGEDWVPAGPTEPPPRRLTHAMSYDRARERVVLFGGLADDLLNDTWEYTGP